MTRKQSARKPYIDAVLDDKGAIAIEFALVVPALALLLLGTIQFGLLMRNYVVLTNAVNVGAMQFAISRSDTTPASDAWTAMTNAAPSLTTSSLTVTLSVGSPATACLTNASSLSNAAAADSTCQTALANAAPSGGTLQPATVNATYPCGSQLTWYNFWSSTCVLTATMTEGVQ
jgi:Flp pilus assembly protein TadG